MTPDDRTQPDPDTRSTPGHRTLSLVIPEAQHRALARLACLRGESPEAVGATLLGDAIGRLGHVGRVRIAWEGPRSGLHSYAQVNREFRRRLIDRGHDLAPLSSNPADRAGQAAEIHVRHQWPPSFVPPPSGHWVIIQPWEYGSPPRSWIGPMIEQVDEVWAYTQFVRDCYAHAGVPADRVHVVPLGVDPSRFHPGARPFRLETTKPIRFLFVGGTIHRKGIDILLKAYAEAFNASDPVCLVIKDLGSSSFYRGQTAEARIDQIRQNPDAPEIEYIDREIGEDELAGLYTACTCLVHRYRGEGFGLPIAEAMACGLPAIVTAYGAALDFCDQERAFLIPARIMRFRQKRIGDLETVDRPWLAEADPVALRDALRAIVDRPAEARAKGDAAARFIREHLTWDHAVDAVEARLARIRERPIRRLQASPSPKPRVSLCMIVKDEAAHLANCLESVAELVDEIVVVDTGSTDDTAAVASRWGARVYPFRWVDSFAEARNESLRHARGDWVFWLDADEGLDEANRERLRGVFSRLGRDDAAYLMRQDSATDDPDGSRVAVDQVRLFRRDPALRRLYRVHEQILLSIRRAGHDLRRTDVVIAHRGYQAPGASERKLQRNLALLVRQDLERPDDPITLYNLGLVHQRLGRAEDALPLLRRSLELLPGDYSIRPRLVAAIARALDALGRKGEALATCRDGRRSDPDAEDLLFFEAVLLIDRGDWSAAEATLLHRLQRPEGQQLASGDAGRRHYKARHLLAEVYHRQGRRAEAEAEWRRVVEEQPRFAPARQRLEEVARAGATVTGAPALD